MDYEVESTELVEQPVAVVKATLSASEIGSWIHQAFSSAGEVAGTQGVGPAGPPFARYHMLDGERFDIEAGFPTFKPIEAEGEVQPSTLPGTSAARTVHVGPFDGVQPAYAALYEWIESHGHQPSGDPWEVYLSDPNTEPDPATWRTEIYAPYQS